MAFSATSNSTEDTAEVLGMSELSKLSTTKTAEGDAWERAEQVKREAQRTSGKRDPSGKGDVSGKRRGRRRRSRRRRETVRERRLRRQREREEKEQAKVPTHPDEERVIEPNLATAATQPTLEAVAAPVTGVEVLLNGPSAIEEVDPGVAEVFDTIVPVEQAQEDIYQEEEVYERPVVETTPVLGTPVSMGGDPTSDSLVVQASAAIEQAREETIAVAEEGKGIPGPGMGPREGTVGHGIQTAVDEKIEEVEKASSEFAGGIRQAGREAGVEAQRRLEEGDIGGALLAGGASAAARFSAGVVEEMTFPLRPKAWVATGAAIVKGGRDVITDPVGSVKGLAIAIARDPGMIVEIAGSIGSGYVGVQAVSTLLPSTQITRLDDLDIDVKRTAYEIVEEPRPLGAIKKWKGPEVELKGTVGSKKVPGIVGEIMEAELDNIGAAKTTLLAVEDTKGVTALTKLDLPTSAVDDLLKGRGTRWERLKSRVTGKDVRTTTTKVDDVIDVEIIELGGESRIGIDPSTSPTMAGIHPEEIDVMGLGAKELGRPTGIIDEVSGLDELQLKLGEKFLDDDLITKPPPYTTGEPVDFGGPWFDEGHVAELPKGRHRFDVKGGITEAAEELVEGADDVVTFIPRSRGRRTPWDVSFPDEAAKKVDDIRPPRRPKPPAPEVNIVDEIVQGVEPVAKATTKVEPAVGIPGFGGLAGMRDARQERRGGRRRQGPPGEFDAEHGPASAWSTPDLRGQEGWEKLNPFYVEPPEEKDIEKDKAATIQRRRKDRRRPEDAPAPPTLVDLLKDDEDTATKPKDVTKPKHRKKQKPRPDQIPEQVPDQVPDVIEVPDVVPVEIPDIIQIPDVVPVEIVEPVTPTPAPPIPIVDVVQTQQQGQPWPPGWPTMQQPLPFKYREPKARRGRRPLIDFGKIDIFRTLHIGTPEQQLRGQFRMGRPLKIGKRKKKRKKGEEEGILSILFG